MTDVSDTFGYSDPVAQLLTIGRPQGGYRAEGWPDYTTTYQLTESHLPDLIRLANDFDTFWGDYDRFDDDDPEIYAMIHALRVIGQLTTSKGLDTLFALALRNEKEGWDSDWHYDNVPSAIALSGEPTLARVEAFIKSSKYPEEVKLSFVSIPQYVAEANADLREQVLALYRRLLAGYNKQSRRVNANLVASLAVLKDVDSAELIKEAFEANTVDLGVSGDWEEIYIELGLLDKRISEIPHKNWWLAEGEAIEKRKEESALRRKKAQLNRMAKAKKQAKAKRRKKRKR